MIPVKKSPAIPFGPVRVVDAIFEVDLAEESA